MFQSTFPRRERRMLFDFMVVFDGVSIHVPAKGTTGSGADIAQRDRSFNPRSREGNDDYHVTRNTEEFMFQSTFPRRERLTKVATDAITAAFQSTFPRRERRA